MMIEFLCPKGHKLRCGDERAGRAAKCPKCGEKFYVPELWELEKSDSGTWPSASDTASGPGIVAAGSGSEPTQGEQVEFLCPNGHRLSAPVQLQGRPGQCPECGSKFHIPTYDDEVAEEEEESKERIDLTSPEDSAMNLDELGAFDREYDSSVRCGEGEIPTAVRSGGADSPQPASKDLPLIDFFSKLWAKKPQAVVIELHLGNGETITPDRFAVELSQGSHGIFAVQESDGTYTLTAVAWESVSRVQVHGLKQLPDGFRD